MDQAPRKNKTGGKQKDTIIEQPHTVGGERGGGGGEDQKKPKKMFFGVDEEGNQKESQKRQPAKKRRRLSPLVAYDIFKGQINWESTIVPPAPSSPTLSKLHLQVQALFSIFPNLLSTPCLETDSCCNEATLS